MTPPNIFLPNHTIDHTLSSKTTTKATQMSQRSSTVKEMVPLRATSTERRLNKSFKSAKLSQSISEDTTRSKNLIKRLPNKLLLLIYS